MGVSNLCVTWSWGGSRVTKQKRNVFIYSVGCLRACAVSLGGNFSVGGAAFQAFSDLTECVFLGATRWWVRVYVIFCRNKENPEYDFL